MSDWIILKMVTTNVFHRKNIEIAIQNQILVNLVWKKTRFFFLHSCEMSVGKKTTKTNVWLSNIVNGHYLRFS